MKSIMVITTTFMCMALFLWRPVVSLTCYQQLYTPGLTNTNNPLINPSLTNLNNPQQQQQQQQLANYGQLNLPTITCSATATSCYKFVCFGTTSYTMKGCLDYTQPQYSCQAMDAQCLGGQGNCYVCNGNNCNGAGSLRGSTSIFLIFLSIPLGALMFKSFN